MPTFEYRSFYFFILCKPIVFFLNRCLYCERPLGRMHCTYCTYNLSSTPNGGHGGSEQNSHKFNSGDGSKTPIHLIELMVASRIAVQYRYPTYFLLMIESPPNHAPAVSWEFECKRYYLRCRQVPKADIGLQTDIRIATVRRCGPVSPRDSTSSVSPR
jgi:hypothetical protein